MRGLLHSTDSRNSSGLNCFKLAASIFSGAHTSKACAFRIYNFLPRILRMVVNTVGIGLPYLDHRIGNSNPITIQYAAGEENTLSFRLRPGNVPHTKFFSGKAEGEERADSLRWSSADAHARSRTAWPLDHVIRCRTCSLAPIAAGWSPGRILKPFAPAPFHPRSIDKWDQRQTKGHRENTSA